MDSPLVTEKNIRFKATRASGPGGQNAGRRSTRVQIWMKVADLALSDDEKKLVREKLAHRINKNDEIEVSNEEDRLQELNRENAVEKMNEIIIEALKVRKPRYPEQ